MEAQAALEGANGRVELNAVAAVDVMHALVIHPGYAEADHALRFHKLFDNALLFVFGVLVDNPVQTLQNLQHGLVELPLVGVTGDNLRIDALQILAV